MFARIGAKKVLNTQKILRFAFTVHRAACDESARAKRMALRSAMRATIEVITHRGYCIKARISNDVDAKFATQTAVAVLLAVAAAGAFAVVPNASASIADTLPNSVRSDCISVPDRRTAAS